MTDSRILRRFAGMSILLLALLFSGTAIAHFKLNLNVRIFHVVHEEDGIDIYLRTPMPYLVADKTGPIRADDLPAPAPYTFNRLEDGVPMHLVDVEALRNDPIGVGRIAADDLTIEITGERLPLDVVSVRVHPNGAEPGFATRAEAEAALSGGSAFPVDAGETYVGNALVDLHLRGPAAGGVGDYRISVSSNPGLPGQEETANLLLDYRDGSPRTYRSRGLMETPIHVSGSAFAAASTFVIEGIRHILEGLDHVLFVICMILGAATLRSLVARVSGFTLGHTVTLILGFFGLAPQGAWFIPAVETSIALSIIFAAADAVIRPINDLHNGRYVVITALIGLLHGFGFSFMLQNILQVDAPNVWQSLFAFNIGVEVGQLIIVAAVWPLVLLLRHRPAPAWRVSSLTTAGVAIIVAAYWVVERAGAIFASVTS